MKMMRATSTAKFSMVCHCLSFWCGLNPYMRKIRTPTKRMAKRLVIKRKKAPPAAVKLKSESSIPTTASGGAREAAMATPAMLSESFL